MKYFHRLVKGNLQTEAKNPGLVFQVTESNQRDHKRKMLSGASLSSVSGSCAFVLYQVTDFCFQIDGISVPVAIEAVGYICNITPYL